MYFIGVTTAQSSSMRIFPRWAELLGLGDAQLVGIDLVPHDEPARYRQVVEFIKNQPLALGALVTTHKLDLFAACANLLDEVEPVAAQLGEVSSLFKRDGRLCASASDPFTSGDSLNAFLATDHWKSNGAEVCILGAGGSSLALSWHLLTQVPAGERPARIVVANRSTERLASMRAFHEGLAATTPVEYQHCPEAKDNDAVVHALAPCSLVANATGLGKDRPGSPLSDAVRFPMGGFAWDFNYRGDLRFLDQARSQREASGLHIEDGWRYFLYGWTRVIGEVFDRRIPKSGDLFEQLSAIAAESR